MSMFATLSPQSSKQKNISICVAMYETSVVLSRMIENRRGQKKSSYKKKLRTYGRKDIEKRDSGKVNQKGKKR